MPVKQPQDRKSKATERVAAEVDGNTYRFAHDGTLYELPPAADAATKIPAGVLIDLVEGSDELAEARLGVAMLKAAGVSEEAMAALRAKPVSEFAEILGEWMQATGVNPGESARSSD